jgi:hypothetical protein
MPTPTPRDLDPKFQTTTPPPTPEESKTEEEKRIDAERLGNASKTEDGEKTRVEDSEESYTVAKDSEGKSHRMPTRDYPKWEREQELKAKERF